MQAKLHQLVILCFFANTLAIETQIVPPPASHENSQFDRLGDIGMGGSSPEHQNLDQKSSICKNTYVTYNDATGKREQTFIMIKPDGVQRNLVGEIIQRFEKKGFQLCFQKFMWADEALVRSHYKEESNKTFFEDLVKQVTSGPVIPMVWEGRDAMKIGRMVIGDASHPVDNLPGSIRGDFSIHPGRNIIHGSHSVESAKREINLWFFPQEIIAWKNGQNMWPYEQ